MTSLFLFFSSLLLTTALPSSLAASDGVSDLGGKGMVVSTSRLAADIGRQILEDGGNAVDAAIAVQFALGVTEPAFVGPFDGCNIVMFNASDGIVRNLDAREEAPAMFHGNIWCQNPDCFKNESCDCSNGPFESSELETGTLGFGVPGCMAAVKRLIDEGRTSKSLKDLVAPAVELARKGHEMDEFLYSMFAQEAKYLAYFNETARMYLNADMSPKYKPGDQFKNPDLANLMERLAEDGGIDDMYTGNLSRLIVDTAKKGVNRVTGRYSPVELSDLASYRAVYRAPVVTKYRDTVVYGPALPYSGGVSLSQMLNWIEHFEIGSEHYATALGRIIDAQNVAFADRDVFLGDADFVDVPLDGLLSKAYTSKRLEELYNATTSMAVKIPVSSGNPPTGSGAKQQRYARSSKRDKGTSHFTVADRAGNVVCWTTTLNSIFGSRVIVPGTGTFLNDQLCDFVPRSNDPVTGKKYANAGEGGKRPRRTALGEEDKKSLGGKRALSSQAPTIVLDAKTKLPILALGSPGGSSIISGVLNVMIGVLDMKKSAQNAVDAPRSLAQNAAPATIESWGDNNLTSTMQHLNAKNYSWQLEANPPPYTETDPKGDGGYHHFGAVSAIKLFHNSNGIRFEGGADKIRVPEAAAAPAT